MDNQLKKLQGNAKCPDLLWDVTSSHSISRMGIVTTRFPVDMEPGEHSHESYELVVPITAMPKAKDGAKIYRYDPGKVYPLNPGQAHGVGETMTGIHFTSVMIDKALMDEVAYSVFGKTGIVFDKKSFSLTMEFRLLMKMFTSEADRQQAGRELVLQSISTQMLVYLLRAGCSKLTFSHEKPPEISHNRINRIIELMQEKYNQGFSIRELAKEANLSPYHFIRAFKAQTGKIPYDYLLDIRIDKIREMMHTDLNLTEICFLSGFNSQSHFTTTFKKRVGITPSRYRKLVKSE